MRRRIIEIGNPQGRIALMLDENDAHDLAAVLGYSDAGHAELMQAIERAYPPPSDDDDEWTPGIRIVVSER